METDPGLRESACLRCEAALEDYLAGDLDASSAKKVEEHLEKCMDCRGALNDAEASMRLFRAAGPLLDRAPDPGPEFSRLVMARIRVETERRVAEGTSFWQPFVSMAWRFAATAMVVLAILLSYAVRGHNQPSQQVASVGQAPLTDVFSPDPTRAPTTQDEVLIMVAESDHGNH